MTEIAELLQAYRAWGLAAILMLVIYAQYREQLKSHAREVSTLERILPLVSELLTVLRTKGGGR